MSKKKEKEEPKKKNNWLRSTISGGASFANSILKIPAFAYKTADMVPVVGMSLPDEVPAGLYDNVLNRTLDTVAERNNYVANEYQSKGESLVSLTKAGEYGKAADYAVNSVLANAPQMAATIAATVFGFGTPALATLALSSSSEALTGAIKNDKDGKLAYGNAVVHGLAEFVGEKLGTISMIKELTKKLGPELAKMTVKKLAKGIAVDTVKAMGSEALEEGFTSVVQQTSSEMFDIEKMEMSEHLDQVIEEFVIGGLSGGLMGGGISAHKNTSNFALDKQLDSVAEAVGGKYVGRRTSKPEGTAKVVETDNPILSKKTKRPLAATYIRSENTTYINNQEAENTFKAKAWTKPKVDGVKPLKKNQFKTLADWKSFLSAHEEGHANSKRGKKESAGAYENRMNTVALNSMNALATTVEVVDAQGKPQSIPTKDFSLRDFIKVVNPKAGLGEDIIDKFIQGQNASNEYVYRFTKSVGRASDRLAKKLGLNNKDVNSALKRFPTFLIRPELKTGLDKYVVDEVKKLELKIDHLNATRVIEMKKNKKVNGALEEINQKLKTATRVHKFLHSSSFQEEIRLNKIAIELMKDKEAQRVWSRVENQIVKRGKSLVKAGLLAEADLKNHYMPIFLEAEYDKALSKKSSAIDLRFFKERTSPTLLDAVVREGRLPLRDTLTGVTDNYLKATGKAINASDMLNSLKSAGLVNIERLAKGADAPSEINGRVPIEVNDRTFNDLRHKSYDPDTDTRYDRASYYVDPALSRSLRVVFGDSKLRDNKGIKALAVLNSTYKHTKLALSGFHHFALNLAYWLVNPSQLQDFKEALAKKDFKTAGIIGLKMSPIGGFIAWKDGVRMRMEGNPHLMGLVKHNMTLGLNNEYSEEILQQSLVLERILGDNKFSNVVGDKLRHFQAFTSSILFEYLGAGLKATTAVSMVHNMQEKNPDMDINKIYALVAENTNANFGGLHHAAMRRDPTLQHLFRLITFAPDWTESNIRLFAKAVAMGPEYERNFYKGVLTTAFARGMAATALLQLFMAAVSEPDEDGIVEEVIDGDTIKMSNGTIVRVLNLDTPEKWMSEKLLKDAAKAGISPAEMMKRGEKASKFTSKLLLGKRVVIEYDPDSPRRKGEYGRTLANVHFKDEKGTVSSLSEVIKKGAYGTSSYESIRKQGILAKFTKLYTEAWEDGNLNWMRVNVTPMLQQLGANPNDRYYYGTVSYFLDPIKYITRDIEDDLPIEDAIAQTLNPFRMATSLAKTSYYKSSFVPQAVFDAMTDTDFTFYRDFTSISDLFETKGDVVRWQEEDSPTRPINPSQVPSWMMYETSKFAPIPVQALVEYAKGDIQGFEVVARFLGQDLKKGYSKAYNVQQIIKRATEKKRSASK